MTPQTYLDHIGAALKATAIADVTRVADALFDAYTEGRSIFVFGDGASAALASHMAVDIGKLTTMDLGEGPVVRQDRRMRINSLTGNAAWTSALGSDLGSEDVFVEQLKNFLRPDDVVIAISGSGSAPSVLRALAYARVTGALCIGMTGDQPGSGAILEATDICVRAHATMIEQIEDLHVIYHHMITRSLFDRIRDERIHDINQYARFDSEPQSAPSRPGPDDDLLASFRRLAAGFLADWVRR